MKQVLALLAIGLILVQNTNLTEEKNKQATEVICNVLENVRTMLITIALAIIAVVYILVLISAAVIHMLLKEKKFKLIRTISKILVIAIPVASIITLAGIHILMRMLSGPC